MPGVRFREDGRREAGGGEQRQPLQSTCLQGEQRDGAIPREVGSREDCLMMGAILASAYRRVGKNHWLMYGGKERASRVICLSSERREGPGCKCRYWL